MTERYNDLDLAKKQLLDDKRYNVIYNKSQVILRELGLNSSIPGYELIRQACCIQIIFNYEEDDDVYNLLGRISMIPLPSKIIKDIRPEKHWMIEAIRAAGIQEDALTFVSNVCSEILKS